MKLSEYDEQVMDYAEYLGVPEYIQTYEPASVARSYMKTIVFNYRLGISVRMTAIILFSMTLNKIMQEEGTKH